MSTNRRRPRVRKARVLAYPADWGYCLAIGFVLGFLVCAILLGGIA